MTKMWEARTYDKGLSSGSGQDQRNIHRRRNIRGAFKRVRFSLSNGKENLETTKSVFCTNLYSTLQHEQPLDDFDKEYDGSGYYGKPKNRNIGSTRDKDSQNKR